MKIQNLEKEILEKQTQMRTLERQIIQNNEAFVANASMVEMQDVSQLIFIPCQVFFLVQSLNSLLQSRLFRT